MATPRARTTVTTQWFGDTILKAARAAAADYIAATAEHVEAIAISLAPVGETGHLAQSIRSRRFGNNKLKWEIVADAPYAAFVELGTIRMAAQPFLRPAVEAAVKFLPKVIATAASKFSRGGYGGQVHIRRSRIK